MLLVPVASVTYYTKFGKLEALSNKKFEQFVRCYRLPTSCRGFVTNELRVSIYELRVTIYCTSCELLFIYELRVITYCVR